MIDAASGPAGRQDQPAARGSGSDGFAELRRLIVGREQDQIEAIEARLDDPDERRRVVADVLPHVLLEHTTDPRFTHALTPPVERAITASVRSNPGPMADALFPVMGPAIRKAVAASLSAMVESLNRTLEHSLSWRSLAWRIEALRTGKSFAEVMLLHTLVYRVEQVFLIERESGLLLQHVMEEGTDGQTADMISGMLTAIRDFVKDSFGVADQDGLEALKVGDLSVWIEQGPRAIIAAVLRGTAPRTYRAVLQQALERVHLEFADEFERFSGDTAPFEAARPTLEACRHTEYRASERPRRRTLWVATGVAALLVVVWAGLWWRDRSRWQRYLDALEAEPGIVVVSTGRRAGRFTVAGLRDPLARDPGTLIAPMGLAAEDVETRWEPYVAAAPALAAARARRVLQPPDGVTVDVADGVLRVDGVATLSWIAEVGRLAPLIPGVERVELAAAAARAATADLARVTPLFVKGSAALSAGQEAVVRQLVASVEALGAFARAHEARFTLTLVGHTDADGAPEANLPLSRARAAVIRRALEPVAADRLSLVDEGVGSDDPAVASEREADKQRNRRVTVRVAVAGDSVPLGRP